MSIKKLTLNAMAASWLAVLTPQIANAQDSITDKILYICDWNIENICYPVGVSWKRKAFTGHLNSNNYLDSLYFRLDKSHQDIKSIALETAKTYPQVYDIFSIILQWTPKEAINYPIFFEPRYGRLEVREEYEELFLYASNNEGSLISKDRKTIIWK